MEINNLISQQIWRDRYQKNGETLNGNIERVAHYISKSTDEFIDFKNIMQNKFFFPAGRTMSNAGIGQNLTLNNCFNLNHVPDSITGIFDHVKVGALTQKAGGGTGYDFSRIRPKGMPTSNDAIASGVVSFMDVFNVQTATILQGNRRGANMGVLNIYHPDIYDFLEAKSWDEGKLVHFNISVMVDDAFMNAVLNEENIFLHFPVYDEKSHIITDESKWLVKREINAKELWDIIMKKAYDTGEYGVLFYDNMNKDNNTWYIETIVSTNPCGEYKSGVLFGEVGTFKINSDDYMGACNLGSLFLHNFVKNPYTKQAYFSLDELEKSIHTAVRMLDNIIDVNKFPYPTYENYQKNMRTIGLGITGIATVFTMLNMKYGDDESVEFTNSLMSFIAKTAYRASIRLAKEKGSFPFLDKEKFVQSGYLQKHLAIDAEWQEIIDDILKYGIRNARILSVAPTGTLSLVFGENCSSGLEPIIFVSTKRKIKIGGQSDENIQIVDLKDYGYELWEKTPFRTVSKDIFVSTNELSVNEHLAILKTIAFHIDMSCSKTINLPTEYSFEATKDVYLNCWKAGIKGVTIFRPNPIRQGIFITDDKKDETTKAEIKLERGDWKPKAKDTVYHERKIYIGCGKLKLFIGWSESEREIQDLYVVRSGNGGCEKTIQSTVISMSGMLRLGGNLLNIEKAFEGMGACNSFVAKRLQGGKVSKGSSCSTAILNEIKVFLKERESEIKEPVVKDEPKKQVISQEVISNIDEKHFLDEFGEIAFAKHFNKCPMCKEQLNNVESCSTCTSCGWTKC